MKKYILGLTLALLILGTAFYKPVKEAMENKPVDKTISFAIYKGYNYKSKAYEGAFAQIHITIEKVRGSKRVNVWEKTFDAKLLKQYPPMKSALTQNVTVSNVIDKKEHLEVSYVLTYNSKGNELQMQSGRFVLDSPDTLDICI